MAYEFPAGVTAQQRNRIVQAFCERYGYTAIPNTPITGDGTNADKLRFFQYQVRQFVFDTNRGHRANAAGAAARNAALAEADADAVALD